MKRFVGLGILVMAAFALTGCESKYEQQQKKQECQQKSDEYKSVIFSDVKKMTETMDLTLKRIYMDKIDENKAKLDMLGECE